MNRAGQYITALGGVVSYKAYKPNPLPPSPIIEMDTEMVTLLSKAHNYLGKLDMMSELIPDMNMFLSAYVRKEALLSSQIEGTQATLEDVLNPNVNIAVNLEVNDVINYVNALNFAIEKMKELPVCNRLLCETHRVLMQGVRGQEKNPGEFRHSQNWIGASNSNLKTARFIPPTVEDMQTAMSDLEKFINDYDMDILLKTSLIHYQFETIHPFLDGNGHIGRMLITLILLANGILHRPVLYLSLYLKTNRIEYYDRLSEVRTKGNYEQWIKFFLHGIIETCEDGIKTIESINSLIKMDEKKLVKKTETISKVFDYIKEHPIITIGGASTALNLSFNGVSNAVKKMVEVNILKEMTTKARDRVFEYTSYIDILKSGT
ncbi:MAG: Fic family protein [Erysipelotrichaceae bacterium]|nr:Fic family protein [Erysipelotrichaceae bacterium]